MIGKCSSIARKPFGDVVIANVGSVARAGDDGAIAQLIEPRMRDLGGFSVQRILPAAGRRLVGPFIFFDVMGPIEFPAGEGISVRPHPHIGLATITWLFAGEIVHRDSLGHTQTIAPGAVNWMVGGRGIGHSERTSAGRLTSGQSLHGIQSWIALPRAEEACAPSFEHVAADAVPVDAGNGVQLALIAGTAFGLTAPVRTFSPIFYVAATLDVRHQNIWDIWACFLTEALAHPG